MRKTFVSMLTYEATGANTLAHYDEEHLVTYRGLLDAEAEGAEWDEAALLVLAIRAVPGRSESRGFTRC